MTDVIDQGCRFEAQFTEMAIANQRARAHRAEQWESAQKCGECGDPIPEERRQKVPGCKYCTQCQSDMERMKR
ncbi:TraR/DksA C4-type zinc finger protein [Photobacterium sp.]|uniref:TraR/DksA C4-type zinc finger protein n=1 Tax=Photobacterium sp. TaxID=660 RepID=UPI00299E1B67|nr:TraR/DksA C4-type zinc finger protein [Photobacterium sp.]MDX1300900.1 TraR/DksA C4-type zinc finger protein [Photobacterium sp.]